MNILRLELVWCEYTATGACLAFVQNHATRKAVVLNPDDKKSNLSTLNNVTYLCTPDVAAQCTPFTEACVLNE